MQIFIHRNTQTPLTASYGPQSNRLTPDVQKATVKSEPVLSTLISSTTMAYRPFAPEDLERFYTPEIDTVLTLIDPIIKKEVGTKKRGEINKQYRALVPSLGTFTLAHIGIRLEHHFSWQLLRTRLKEEKRQYPFSTLLFILNILADGHHTNPLYYMVWKKTVETGKLLPPETISAYSNVYAEHPLYKRVRFFSNMVIEHPQGAELSLLLKKQSAYR